MGSLTPGPALTYLDTNVFILLREGFGEIQRLLIDLVAGQPAGKTARFATSELTLAELLAKPYAEEHDELIDQYDSWILESSWLQVGPVTRDVLRYAAVLRAHYRSIKLPDAIHLSTAFGLGCKYILTSDAGLKESYEIVHTRHGSSKFSPELKVLRPDAETLVSLTAELAR